MVVFGTGVRMCVCKYINVTSCDKKSEGFKMCYKSIHYFAKLIWTAKLYHLHNVGQLESGEKNNNQNQILLG